MSDIRKVWISKCRKYSSLSHSLTQFQAVQGKDCSQVQFMITEADPVKNIPIVTTESNGHNYAASILWNFVVH